MNCMSIMNSFDSKMRTSTFLPVRGFRTLRLPGTPFSISPLWVRNTSILVSTGSPVGKASSVTPSKVHTQAASVPPLMKLRYVHSSPTLMPFSTGLPAGSRKPSFP